MIAHLHYTCSVFVRVKFWVPSDWPGCRWNGKGVQRGSWWKFTAWTVHW